MAPLERKGFIGKAIEKWIAKIRSEHVVMFTLLDEISDYGQLTLFNLHPRNKLEQEIYISALYMRILATYQAMILTAERGMVAQAGILSRAMIESLFIMGAISKSLENVRDYVHSDFSTRKASFKKYWKHRRDIPEDYDPEKLRIMKAELDSEIEEKGIKPIKVREWACRANLEYFYDTVYIVLSNHIHTNVRDLDRHFVMNDRGEIVEFNWGPDTKDLYYVVTSSCDCLIRAIICASSFFKILNEERINDFSRRIEQIAEQHVKERNN